MFHGSTSTSPQASSSSSRIVEENESVYELYRPEGTPSAQIVFFHGLQQGDYSEAHWSTWQSGDMSCVWPQAWLAEEFPGAQVFCVSYTVALETMSEVGFDMFLMTEIVMSDLIRAQIGQVPLCPVVLVGHSIGGLLIKELCCHANEMPKVSPELERKLEHRYPRFFPDFGKTQLENFFDNLRGMVFYATPHVGSRVASAWAAIAGELRLKFFIALLKDIEWLNVKFSQMRKAHDKWLFAELWESRPTKSMFMRDPFERDFQMVVSEPSTRAEKVNIVVKADHFSICRPYNKTSSNFSILKDFLDPIVNDAKEERRRREDENLQPLPEFLVGIDLQQSDVTGTLKNVTTVSLVGLKGVGKTTLAMAIFNELGPKFEFSCFVSDVKLFKGDANDLKDYVWKHMHRNGKKIGNQSNWSELESKQLFLVLDDISNADDRDKTVLSEIVSSAAQESRFILTSRDARDGKLLHNLGDIYNVQFLDDDSAEQLFMNHALPNFRIPEFLEFTRVVKHIIKHCEGLPLSLEVLGKYLSTKQNENDWMRALRLLNAAKKEKIFDHGSWEKLWLFYQALEENEKPIFEESIRGGQHFKTLHEKEDRVNLYNWYEDPITWEKMCDPVTCSDGRTYDRWTIIDKGMNRSPYDRMTTFEIKIDNIDVRSKLFGAFPQQEVKFRKRRLKYREEALQHARAYPYEAAAAIEKLNNILKWLPLDTECRDELCSLLNRMSQERQPPIKEDVLLTVSTVTDESQIPAPEGPEDVMSRVAPVSAQEGDLAYEIPMVSHEGVIRARGVISHEELIRERGRALDSRLNTLFVFLFLSLSYAIMFL